jgi:hypothetical protein
MAKNNGGNNNRKRKGGKHNLWDAADMGNLKKRARREVRQQYAPVFREFRDTMQDTRRTYDQDAERLDNIYGRVRNQMEPLGAAYQDQAAQIQRDLAQNMGSFAGLLGTGAAPESAAAGALFANMGMGGQQMLAGERLRNAGYQRFAGQQANFDQASAGNAMLQEMRNTIDDLKTGRLDARQDMQSDRATRLDELRDTQFERELAIKEFLNRKRLAEKDFGLKKKAFKSDRKDQKRSRKFAQNEVEREQERRERRRERRQDRRLTGDIKEVKSKIKQLNQQIEKYEAMGNDPFAQAQLAKLRKKKDELQAKVQRKRKRRAA